MGARLRAICLPYLANDSVFLSLASEVSAYFTGQCLSQIRDLVLTFFGGNRYLSDSIC